MKEPHGCGQALCSGAMSSFSPYNTGLWQQGRWTARPCGCKRAAEVGKAGTKHANHQHRAHMHDPARCCCRQGHRLPRERPCGCHSQPCSRSLLRPGEAVQDGPEPGAPVTSPVGDREEAGPGQHSHLGRWKVSWPRRIYPP